jgi:hypothetical protein
MALSELDVVRVRRWCAARVPEHARHQVRVECQIAARHLTIVERRAPWREDFGPDWTTFPIARLRYTDADKSWTLYWRDRTSASTSTTSSHHRLESTTCSAGLTTTPPASSGADPAAKPDAPLGPATSVTVGPPWVDTASSAWAAHQGLRATTWPAESEDGRLAAV